MIICKSAEEIRRMRRAGLILAELMNLVAESVAPQVKTKDLDKFIEDYIVLKGGRPAFKGYRDFPAASCISVNEVVVHGIPGERKLKEGEIVSIDIGIELDGYYADTAATFPVGKISSEAKQLIATTKKALEVGISLAKVGNHLYDISRAIQEVAEGAGYSVVREYVGHGIGRQMHEDPQIPNYAPPGKGPQLEEGMVLALEPMVNLGRFEVEVLDDNWTVVTLDRSLSAHFEHTVAVTSSGPEILTLL